MFIDVRVILDMQFLSAHLLIWEIANLNLMFYDESDSKSVW